MAENTKIEWAHHTSNPWVGCTKVSPACDHCYAEGWAKRSGMVQWGAGAERRRTTPANWRMPEKWNRQARIQHDAWEGFKTTNPGLTDEQLQAQGFIKPQRPRVFCSSLADVFDNAVPTEWRYDLFNLILSTPHLDWLLLTKRIGNAERMITEAISRLRLGGWKQMPWPWSNVWLGATVVNQEEADRDIPKLLAVPAAKRFLSMEPLLGPADIRQWLGLECRHDSGYTEGDTGATVCRECADSALIDWVIVGGESGPKARPMHPDWARSLRDQCAAAAVPFLFKQWGDWWEVDSDARDDEGNHIEVDPRDITARELWNPARGCLLTADGRRFTPATLPDDTPGRLMTRIGKKAAGRLLDGIEHNGFPK